MRIEQLRNAPDRAGRYWVTFSDGTRRGRVLVFLADGSLLKVTEQELLTFGLRSGDELDEETLTRLKEAAGVSNIKTTAADLVGRRAMSRQDLEKKLQEKGASETEARYAGEWLEAIGALDDGAYAAALVRHCGDMGYGPRRAREKLREKGVPQELWDEALDELPPEPSYMAVQKLVDEFKVSGADLIVACGGGSVMDAAKLASVLVTDAYGVKELLDNPGMAQKCVPIVLIPTTAGTGSEVTPFAVITDETTGVKYPLADYELLPKMAIVDADMMMSAPKGLTSASGIDALTHALEAYASMLATDFTDGLAKQAAQLIFEYLPACYDNGQNEPVAREKMGNAATMAGMAFANAFLGVCHSMAHKLGAFHHLPHGIANALLIELVIRYNSAEVPTKMGTFPQYAYPHTKRRYAEFGEFLGFKGANDDETVENLIRNIHALKERVGIKNTIRDYGVDEEKFLATLDEMSEQAFDDQCTGANPRYPLISEIKEMYLKAYYGE